MNAAEIDPCSEDSAPSLLYRLERAELEQPLVFFRDDWDFRWMSGHQVLARIGLGESNSTIVDERGRFEEPRELTHFCVEFDLMVRGKTHAPPSDPDLEDLARESEALLGVQRPSIVLPGSSRDDDRLLLRLGIELGAAFVLPPDPATFVWTVCTTRPTMLAANCDQLRELVAELSTRSAWRRRRILSATRVVYAIGSAKGEDETQRTLASWMRAGTLMQRILVNRAS